MTLENLQARAKALGLVIEEDHVHEYGTTMQLGFWLLVPETGEGPFEDGNFATSLEELDRVVAAAEELS